MSADNIAVCPECGELKLREWKGLGINDKNMLVVDYRCWCSGCDYEWKFGPKELAPITGMPLNLTEG